MSKNLRKLRFSTNFHPTAARCLRALFPPKLTVIVLLRLSRWIAGIEPGIGPNSLKMV